MFFLLLANGFLYAQDIPPPPPPTPVPPGNPIDDYLILLIVLAMVFAFLKFRKLATKNT